MLLTFISFYIKVINYLVVSIFFCKNKAIDGQFLEI